MKKSIVILVLFSAALLLCCCSEKTPQEQTTKPQHKFSIAYCINNLEDMFQVRILEAVQREIIAAGGELLIKNAEGQPLKQYNQAMRFTEQKVDGIFIVPVDISAAENFIELAGKEHIPLCFVNRSPFADKEYGIPDGVFFVGSRDKIAGRLQAEQAIELLHGKGGVALLEGQADTSSKERTKGCKEIFIEKFPSISIVAEASADQQQGQIANIVHQWLETYGDNLNAILANTDEIALEVIPVLEQCGRTDVILIGIDGIIEGKAAIQQGKMAASIVQDTDEQGKSAAAVMLEAINGGRPAVFTWIPPRIIDKAALNFMDEQQ